MIRDNGDFVSIGEVLNNVFVNLSYETVLARMIALIFICWKKEEFDVHCKSLPEGE